MARILVTGYMVRHPLAGNLFAFFHYVLGFARLGHDVVYVEESGWTNSSYDPRTQELVDWPAYGLQVTRDLAATHSVVVPIVFVDRDTRAIDGMSWTALVETLLDCDLLLNVGGISWLPDFARCRRRALIDMDPLFTQVGRFGAELLESHDVLFTYGANVGRPGCRIPTLGRTWLATYPPVVPDLWTTTETPASDAFTTIASWNAYGRVTHENEEYGQKDEEFRRLRMLPRRAPARLEVALSGAPGEVIADLTGAGWTVRDGGQVSRSVADYREYVMTSRGEFGVAKHAYVKSRSGWFSDRSVCYLAAGRPAVLQDTGFTSWLPTGSGVLAFETEDEAVDALRQVLADYDRHARAARDVAESVFDYRIVLPRLLELSASAPPRRAMPAPTP
jgi:hypothetical protein